jgi:hypothetical protein
MIRRLLAGTLVVGLIGTGAELLLLGHYDGLAQYTPLVMIGIALIVVPWTLLLPSVTSLTAMRLVMVAFVVSGAVGVGLHLDGNEEFELEMAPNRQGLDLLWKSLTGATPVLAPGAMSLLGLIGLAQAYRHPAASRDVDPGMSDPI